MHQPRRVALHSHKFIRSRSASNAVRLKPRPQDASSEAYVPRPLPKKWSLPVATSLKQPSASSCNSEPGVPFNANSLDLSPETAGRYPAPSRNVFSPRSPSLHNETKSPIPLFTPQNLSRAPSGNALLKWSRVFSPPQATPSDTQPAFPLSNRHQEPAKPFPSITKRAAQPPVHLRPTSANRNDTSHEASTSSVQMQQTNQQSPSTYIPGQRYQPSEIRRSRDLKSRRVEKRPEYNPFFKARDNDKTRLSASSPEKKISKSLKLVKKETPPVYIPSTVSVGALARLLDVKLDKLQRQIRRTGLGIETAYDHVLTSDYAVLFAEELGRKCIVNDEAAFDLYPSPLPIDHQSLPFRPPVVTIMGHVDHGKTTLLDTLRSSSVAKGEAGGITQHIGAFSVPVEGGLQSITFLDTPGHAAFSAMRARGASVTDIIVLVVAADDGIMPQTREVIDLIKSDGGKMGVVVAINKIDKPHVDVDGVQKALMAEGLQLEVFGGDIPCVEVSGLTGQGLPELIETLSVMAEIQDLRAPREGPVHGCILESRIQQGLGPVATVLVLRGRLSVGSHLLSGVSHAKIRVVKDQTGANLREALPGMAVLVSGWKTLPNAGDEVLQGPEADIKKAVINRLRKAEVQASLLDVEAINENRRQEREQRQLEADKDQAPAILDLPAGPKELRLVIKADVCGSAEAIVGALQGIGNKEAVTKIVSSGVGDITESDVLMAKAIGGTVVGFSVRAPRAIEMLAAQNGVPICVSDIIYHLMDEIKSKVIDLLPTITETKVVGEATVLQLFDIQLKAKQIRKVAGCRVTNGLVEKSRFARVVREGVTIHEGTLDTMRHLKKEVTEVRKGSECGLSLSGFDDLQPGDLIQMVQKIEKPGSL